MRDQQTLIQDVPVQTNEVSIDAYGRVTLLDPDLLELVSGGRAPTNGSCPIINAAPGCGVKQQ